MAVRYRSLVSFFSVPESAPGLVSDVSVTAFSELPSRVASPADSASVSGLSSDASAASDVAAYPVLSVLPASALSVSFSLPQPASRTAITNITDTYL